MPIPTALLQLLLGFEPIDQFEERIIGVQGLSGNLNACLAILLDPLAQIPEHLLEIIRTSLQELLNPGSDWKETSREVSFFRSSTDRAPPRHSSSRLVASVRVDRWPDYSSGSERPL